MRVSRNWLQKYVKIGMADAVLAEKLTMAGLEVEGVESQAENLAGIIVGEVVSVEKHPFADRLSVCRVSDGSGEVQVVCGAPNVAAGQKIAFAPVGTTVRHNQHDPSGGPLSIGQVKIRNIDSFGMICSGYELGLSEDRDGIMVLEPSAKPGRPLSRQLKMEDTVFEIGVTANRPDLLSHIGVAREIGAITGAPLRIPGIRTEKRFSREKLPLSVKVEDRVHCPRYSARIVTGITVGPSPPWLQASLTAVGVRPINNVVDVTNYVLMEIGQPLHAFDYDRISGARIVVRCPGSKSWFVTLDGKRREIDEETLLICDGQGPVALAGVMGGENSEISETTTRIVLESAFFNPASIRRTSKKLALSTEASQRFERGSDPGITIWAMNRAAELLSEVAGGVVDRKVIDIYPRKILPKKVRFNQEKSDQLLGIKISEKISSDLLRRIGITRTRAAKGRSASIYSLPTWRPDLSREVDLIEEVARLYGYDRIAPDTTVRISIPRDTSTTDLSDGVKTYLSSAGFNEIITNSMGEASVGGEGESGEVVIANPISREIAVLRIDLLRSMLTVIKHNIFNGVTSSRFFEIGKTYRRHTGGDPEDLGSFQEEERLIMALFGDEYPLYWGAPATKSSIFTLKGECNALFNKISLDNPVYIPYPTPTPLSERSIFIEISGERVGMIGTVSKNLKNQMDLETDIHFLDISLDAVRKHTRGDLRFTEYSRYPTVTRDIALVVAESVTVGSLEETIRAAAGEMLGTVTLFDIYRGDQLGDGKKSCAFSLEFVPREKTLDQAEIQAIMRRITDSLISAFHAELRQ